MNNALESTVQLYADTRILLCVMTKKTMRFSVFIAALIFILFYMNSAVMPLFCQTNLFKLPLLIIDLCLYGFTPPEIFPNVDTFLYKCYIIVDILSFLNVCNAFLDITNQGAVLLVYIYTLILIVLSSACNIVMLSLRERFNECMESIQNIGRMSLFFQNQTFRTRILKHESAAAAA